MAGYLVLVGLADPSIRSETKKRKIYLSMQEVETGAKPGRGRKKKVVVPPDVKLEAEEEPDKQTTESQVSCEKQEVNQKCYFNYQDFSGLSWYNIGIKVSISIRPTVPWNMEIKILDMLLVTLYQVKAISRI